jgi:LysM repeat protein
MSERPNGTLIREVPSGIRGRVDREFLVELALPIFLFVALVTALALWFANQPDKAPAPSAPAASAAPAPAPTVARRQPAAPGATAPAPAAPAAPAAPSASAPAGPAAPSAPSVSGQPRQQPQQRTYRVVAGDTLASVALRHGVGYQQIAEDNQLANPNLINPGQQLRIDQPSPGVRLIQPGDTLTGLAQETGVSVPQLLELNPWISNPNRIQAGAGLRVST